MGRDASQSAVSSQRRSLEERLADWIGGFGPWLAPVPSAALVFWAMQIHFVWATPGVALAGAVVIEVLGFSAINTALMLHDWNGRRPEGEKAAPFRWAALIVGVYLLTTVGLTVVLNADDRLTPIAPALFPVMALVGSVNIALRTQHKQRLARIAEAKRERKADEAQRKAERKAEREAKRKTSVNEFGVAEAQCKTLQDFEDFADVKKTSKAWGVLRQLVYERDQKRCKDCGKDLENRSFHCHHVRSAVYGGAGKPSNLITLCDDCHAKRHGDPETFTRIVNGRAAKKAYIVDAMLNAYRVNPLLGDTELGGMVGCTRQTVYNYKRELAKAGKVKVNGNGVEVCDDSNT